MEDKEPRQLDLTESITDVPQANNIARLIALMEAIHRGKNTFSELAQHLEVEERTVRYYADLARWLYWVKAEGEQELRLTEEGFAFAESVPARGRLFSAAMSRRSLVQTINSLKREKFQDLDEPESTHKAALEAIQKCTKLAVSTAERRAQGLTTLLQWAYQPRELDWKTGEASPKDPIPFSFKGRSFLTELESRRFGISHRIEVAFPFQVVLFGTGQLEKLTPTNWVRASYDLPQDGRWFGSIPMNPSTQAVARRRGPDLRQILLVCNPYITLLLALVLRSPKGFPALMTFTDDMYGLKLWSQDRALGPPGKVLKKVARRLDLHPSGEIPHLQGRHCKDEIRSGTQREFTELLLFAGFLQREETNLVPASSLRGELQRSRGDGPTLYERLTPLQEALRENIMHDPFEPEDE